MKTKQVVVVTGASAGLGRAIVREFAKDGADVGLIARGVDGLEGAKRDVEACGGRAVICPVDVADADAIDKAADEIEAQLGPIDVWVNNAMTSVFAPIKDMTAEEYKRVTEVTYLGQVYGTMSALKRMQPRNKGLIILVGSALAYRGIPLQSAYCASKHAIHGFYDSLRSELMHDSSRIKTCMVQLPAMNTTQFGFVRNKLPRKPRPMGTIYEPEVAARGIVWASKHPRRELYIGWPTVEAIVGNKVSPAFADYVLSKTGYNGQMTDEPADPNHRDTLWEPKPGDHGAHGPFDDKSWSVSPELWAAKYKVPLVAFGLAAVAGLFLAKR